jgi:hypothetical protein
MKPKVYLETSFLSFLTARPTRDVVMAAMIKQSAGWWAEERGNFDLFVSDLVGMEALAGDPDAARRRQEVLQTIPALLADAQARSLAGFFLTNMALPANAADDALHIAIATVNQLDYLLTWNCRHIANAVMRPKLESLCLAQGQRCPVICTPPELRNTK